MIDINRYGGFGTGALGTRTISSTTTRINSFAKVTAISNNGYTVTIANALPGSYGSFEAGQEVMFHVTNTTAAKVEHFGKYGIATIQVVDGSNLTLSKAVPVTDITGLTCQLVTIPQFEDVTIASALQAEAWNATSGRGGILAIKAKGTVDLRNGSLISEGKGMSTGERATVDDMDNYYLHEKLPMSEGNGIVVVIAKELLLAETSRLGASWSGALGAGAAGSGGAGLVWNHNAIGNSGYDANYFTNGVNGNNGNIGTMTQTGRNGYSNTIGGSGGADVATQYSAYPISPGGEGGNNSNGSNGNVYIVSSSGRQAFLSASVGTGGIVGKAGATVLIVVKDIPAWSLACLSTGGNGGNGGTYGYINDTQSYGQTNIFINRQFKNSTYVSSFASNGGVGGNGGAGYSGGSGGGGGSEGKGQTDESFGISGSGGGGGAGGGAGYGLIVTSARSVVPEAPYATAYGLLTDLAVDKYGLFISNEPIALTGTAGQIRCTGTQPTGTNRRVVFRVNGVLYKLTTDAEGAATAEAVATQTPTTESVLAEGNSVTELSAVRSIPAWDGASVYPIIALYKAESTTAAPTLKIGIDSTAVAEQYDAYRESPEYELMDTDTILASVEANVSVTGQGTATVEARIMQDGIWSNYQALTAVQGQRASKIQFRARYGVATLGSSDSARVVSARVVYAGSSAKVSGSTSEIYVWTQDFGIGTGLDDVGFAHATVHHAPLRDSEIGAYAAFRSTPEWHEMVAIGTGTGARETYQLPGTRINFNSIQIYVDGERFRIFDANTEVNEVTLTAPLGAAISATYQDGWEPEVWREMMLVSRQKTSNVEDDWASRYTYTVPAGETKKTICGIRYELRRPEGDVTIEELGTATGETQVFLLPHFARKDTISLPENVGWDYNDETRVLKVIASKGTNLTLSYHWVAESQVIHSLAAGWAKVVSNVSSTGGSYSGGGSGDDETEGIESLSNAEIDTLFH
ncbi:MAG: hypothetical protein IJS96_03410 [Schwartzia sp.]|nr:hypothetical protein [Schwartzia sp. (in: firmicutes)]